jgi:hypothetical protein
MVKRLGEPHLWGSPKPAIFDKHLPAEGFFSVFARHLCLTLKLKIAAQQHGTILTGKLGSKLLP